MWLRCLAFGDSRNSSLVQSLNDFSGAACHLRAVKIPAPPSCSACNDVSEAKRKKHLNLTQDTRISVASLAKDSEANLESHESLESRFKDLDLNIESKTITESTSHNLSKALPDSNNVRDSASLAESNADTTPDLDGFAISIFEIGSNILEHNFYHYKLSESSKHRYWCDKYALRKHKIICKIAPKQVAFVFRPKYLRSFQKARNYTNGRGMLLVFRFSKVSLARISHKVCLRVSYGADRGDFKDSLARWHTSTKNHRQSEDIRHIFRLQTRARVLYPGFYQQR